VKLAKPDHRRQLVIDSGFRCHLTEYTRATASEPSAFVRRLRKYLKTRRVSAVKQLGTDRIIDISFSDGLYHLFLEFFASGNIILTDGEYKILSLIRTVPTGESQEEVKLGLTYNVSNKQNYHGLPALTTERLRSVLKSAVKEESEKDLPSQLPVSGKKSKKKQANELRKALSQGFPEFPPVLLDHAVAAKHIDLDVKPQLVLQDESRITQVFVALQEAEQVLRSLLAGERQAGFIIAKEKATVSSSTDEMDASQKRLLYDDFEPFRPRQFADKPGTTILEFEGYNKTVDEFFAFSETQTLESRLTEHEETARRRMVSARSDHEKRVGALKQAQELHIRKAEAISANVYRVQEAIDAMNGLIAQGMDWVEVARLVEMEQKRNNPVAQLIKLPLKLYENTVTLILGEANYEDDDDDDDEAYGSASDDDDRDESVDEQGKVEPTTKSQKSPLLVDIDLGLSPWANSRLYYEQKKSSAVKEQKTVLSSERALKGQEKKISTDLKKQVKNEKQVLRATRNPFWFEKYTFFISTDGYLVLG
jgi:predicted ribosome quality control (RQC) complex YloA/Tae2 family protein